MIINPVKIISPNFLPVFKSREFAYKNIQADTVTIGFKSGLIYGKLPDEFNIDIANISDSTPGVLEANDTGYLAQIFKFKPMGSQKVYAIKKLWPEHLAKHITANPVEQLKTEAQVYERVVGLPNVPKFYYYKGDFLNTPEALPNNYLVMEWVDGKSASPKGTFYDLNLIDKDKLGKIYNLLFEFDKRGVLHNDLWAGNILFTEKDVNIIDFNRSMLYNPVEDPQINNIDSFKERFLGRYLSDVYQKLGEDALVDSYKHTTILESDLLKKKAKFFNSKGLKFEAQELMEKSDKLRKATFDDVQMRDMALKEVFDTDLRCGKIYAKYFEFEDGESLECCERLKNFYPKMIM